MEYLLILGFFLVAGLFTKWKFKIQLYQSWKGRIVIPLIFFLIGFIWDYFAISHGHWTYLGPGVIGTKIGLIPIEDYLFFLILPFFGLTFYKLLDKKIH
ncbi:MAG: lycopene cyclase domain-containing protein [Patescibacteria group bacterium]